MRRRLVTLSEAVQEIVDEHGGVRAASRATGVDKAFISRLLSGKRVNPSSKTLVMLGLLPISLYERIKP